VCSKQVALLVVLAFISCFPSLVAADGTGQGQGSTPRIETSLITILPGKPVYSSFGHTAVRVIDHGAGTDRFYTYGQSAKPFDFLFVNDLLHGRMDFMVDAFNTKDAFRFYREIENRTIIEQTLQIDQEHAARLKERVERDSRPENSTYRYRFFTDNCATRVVVLLDEVLADLEPQVSPSVEKTFRESIDEVLEEKNWLRLGLNFLLGPFADQTRSVESAVFLPREIMDQAAGTTIQGLSGRQRFVGQPQLVFLHKDEAPSIGFPSPAHLFAGLLILSVLLAFRAPNDRLSVFIFDAVLFGGIAILGFVPGFLWLSSGYEESAMNMNLLWANPLPLVALVWQRVRPRHRIPKILFSVELAVVVAFALFGGFGIQGVAPEIRLVCAFVAFRYAAFLGLPGLVRRRGSRLDTRVDTPGKVERKTGQRR